MNGAIKDLTVTLFQKLHCYARRKELTTTICITNVCVFCNFYDYTRITCAVAINKQGYNRINLGLYLADLR